MVLDHESGAPGLGADRMSDRLVHTPTELAAKLREGVPTAAADVASHLEAMRHLLLSAGVDQEAVDATVAAQADAIETLRLIGAVCPGDVPGSD